MFALFTLIVTGVVLQTTSPTVVGMLLTAALAILLPMAGTWLAMQLSKLNATVAAWPEWEKRLLTTVWGLVMGGLSHAVGFRLPEAWGALGSVEIQGLLGAVFAMLLHRVLNPTRA
jgi:hypothetical protein